MPKMSGAWQGDAPNRFSQLTAVASCALSAFTLSERRKRKVLVEMNLISEHTSRCTECVMEVLLRVLLMHQYHRERERDSERLRGRAGVCVCVCVPTCYIIKRGGRERCLSCHTTATRFDRRWRGGVSELHSTTRNALVWRHSSKNIETKGCLYWILHNGAQGHLQVQSVCCAAEWTMSRTSVVGHQSSWELIFFFIVISSPSC